MSTCFDCKHWEPRDGSDIDEAMGRLNNYPPYGGEDAPWWGVCNLTCYKQPKYGTAPLGTRVRVSGTRATAVGNYRDDAFLLTRADFGCNQFEPEGER